MYIWHETPEEGQRMHRPIHCEYNDEDNDLNILSKILFLEIKIIVNNSRKYLYLLVTEQDATDFIFTCTLKPLF